MALRKFSKYMKVVTVIVIFAFLFTSAYAGYMYLTTYLENRKTVILKIDDIKLYKEDLEAQYEQLNSSIEKVYDQTSYAKNESFIKIPEEKLRELALSIMLDNAVLEKLSSNLKVKVSKKDINEEVKKIEDQVGGQNQLAIYLATNGSNLTNLKEQIKKQLVHKGTLDKLKESIKPSDEELLKVYNRFKYEEFSNKTFEEVKEDVEQKYYETYINILLYSATKKIFDDAVITSKDEATLNMVNELRKIIVEYEGLSHTREELVPYYINEALVNGKGYTEDLETTVNEQKLKDLKNLKTIEDKAKELGITVPADLTPVNEAKAYYTNYFYYLVDTYQPTEAEMKSWFNYNIERYNTQNTVSGHMFGMIFIPSENDWDKAQEKATELMKTLTVDNFEEVAKKESEDTSAVNGGDLGMTDVNKFVPEFADSLNHKEGEIYGPIRTEYGYHIIEVVEKDKNNPNKIHLKHILIRPKVSEETKQEDIAEILNIKNDIEGGVLTWDDITNDTTGKYDKFNINSPFDNIIFGALLPQIGNSADIVDELFEIKDKTFITKETDNSYLIVQKLGEVPFKKANFEDLKERVRLELAYMHANTELSK